MSRTRIAVIGVGALGRWHAHKLAAMEQAALIGVVDRDAEMAQSVADECQTTAFTDAADIIDQVDAVSIVVPTSFHLAVAEPFLRRGLPVFFEKPLAASTAQARELAALAQQHDCLLQVGHIERFNPAMVAALPLIDEPRHIRAERLSAYAFRSMDVGVVHDLMIHDIDLIHALVPSPLVSVDAFGATIAGGHEDTVNARLRFANGCIADLHANRVSPVTRREMQVWAPDATVTINFGDKSVTCMKRSDALRFGPTLPERAAQPDADIDALKQDVFGRFITVDELEVPNNDALNAELTAFVNAVRDQSDAPVTAADGVTAMETAERILDQVARHQWDGHADGRIGPDAGVQRRRAG